jgi:hypothetical protein
MKKYVNIKELDLYNIIINDPVYLTIAIILSCAVIFFIIKKMFKYLVVLFVLILLYIGYLVYSGEEIPKTTKELMDDISEKTENTLETLKDKTDGMFEDANLLLKNNGK